MINGSSPWTPKERALRAPSYRVGDDGRVVQIDQYGNKQPQKPQYAVKDGKIYEMNSRNCVRYDKPSYAIGSDGVAQADAYGNKLYGKPQYKVEGEWSTRRMRGKRPPAEVRHQADWKKAAAPQRKIKRVDAAQTAASDPSSARSNQC
jgi:hypothetical protein